MPKEYPFKLSDLNQALEDELGMGEELLEEEFDELQVNPPKRSSFPKFIFICAVVKDIIDIVGLGILGTIINPLMWIIIRLWLFRKVSFVQRMLYKRFIFALIIEFVPGANWIPQWSIFVLRGHAAENKKVDEILRTIEGLLIRFEKGKL